MASGSSTSQPQDADRLAFESAVQALEAQTLSAGAHLTWDARVRHDYGIRIRAFADDLRSQAMADRITWREAATQAGEVRNVTLELLRRNSTPVGRAFAQRIKPEGVSLNEMIARKTLLLHGAQADFRHLSAVHQEAVFAEIVKSAGKSDWKVDAAMRRLGAAGKGLVFLSLALSVYQVAVADDKMAAAGRELAVTGAGIAGSMAGGALAGLACGPGAPVCVVVGAFVFGALAAFGTDMWW